ncbi:hypothetical protein FQN60_012384, partial [Etheostoma spectabile]
MQLLVCLLLFIITTVWLESGWRVSVRCVLNEEDQVLDSGGTALLSGCDGNKATFNWTGPGRSSNEIQLFYYVKEGERNSSEDHTSPHTDQDLLRWSQTGTSFTSTAPVGQEVVTGTQGGRGHLYKGLEWSSGPRSASSPSSQGQRLLPPTSPLQGLTVAGRADRETLPLPEEEPNNGADTSGAAHLTDGKMAAKQRTHPNFLQTLIPDTLFHTSDTAYTQKQSSNELPQTQMAITHATASSSNTLHGTEIHKYTDTQTSKPSITVQAQPIVSSSSAPPLTSSPHLLHSRRTWESGTILIPHGGAISGVPGEKQPHSWRSQQNTDGLNSDLTSAITSDPLKSPTELQQDESSSAQTDTEPTASSSSSSPGSSWTRSSATHITWHDTAFDAVEAASFHPNISRTDSSLLAVSDVNSQTAALESSDKFENAEVLHTFTSSTQSQTNSPQSTESVTRSPLPDTSPLFTQTSNEETQMESIELLLQIIVGEFMSSFTSGLEEDTIAWVKPYLQKAPGFSRLLGVWSSGALQWLSMTGSTSLMERTGLAQAVRDGRSFRSSKITNVTLGEDFWYMGQRCDMRMTRVRLVGACLAILLIMVTVIGVLAFVAVRRYRAILIQAKIDQTRSSYRRFNHFDELSGRFWLRSWAGSADSLDNPAFTRSDELLHMRALDRPCCYHDDTLSLASTCASHGTRINTIYPHSSQYGWRGSEMSMGDGVLDSGKASDLSVCSWP